MTEYQLDSYCGLYCGACEVIHEFKKANEAGREPLRENLPEVLRKNLPVPKGTPIICYGCKSDTVFLGCSKCPIRKCAKKTGIESCSDCHKYPCMIFKIYKFMITFNRITKKWTHLAAAPNNLVSYKKIGKAAWLKEQDEYWRCSNCNSKRYWYSKDCEC